MRTVQCWVPAASLLAAMLIAGCDATSGPVDAAISRDARGHDVDADLDAGALDAALPRLDGSLPTTDLCQGLVRNDRADHPRTALVRPAVGASVIDPAFGTTIRRVAAGRVPMYSTVSAWNADETWVILYEPGVGHYLHDGDTFAELRALDIAPNDLEHVYWHTSDPDVLFYVEGRTFVRYHVGAGRREAVREFADCDGEASAGGDPFFTSFDSRLIGLVCGSTHFLYRIDTDTIVATREAPGRDLGPQAAPTGLRAYWGGDVVGADLALERTLALDSPYEHASMGLTPDGRDTYLTVSFDGRDQGTLVAYDMTTGAARVVIGEATGYPYPPGGTHISGMAYRAPGWAWISIVGEGSGETVLDGELLVADFATGDVCRVAHHRSTGDAYFAEPHVVPSPTGTRALFGSDWGGGEPDAYVVELPAHGR